MKENQNTISHACTVLAEAIREIPEVSGLFSGTNVYVYAETDEDFAQKLEATISQNTGIVVFVRSDGWSEACFHGDSICVLARFTVRIISSLLLNGEFASSTTDLAARIAKHARGVAGDGRFITSFTPGEMSVFETAGTITRELIFTATLEL